MKFLPNDLFFTMAELFATRVTPDEKIIVGNEGSSRSSKTWDTFHFIVALCDQNRETPLDIYILRDTLVNCRDFTLTEFQNCLKVIGIYEERNMVNSPKPVYNLFGHKIKFRGLDDEQTSEGYPSDVLFFNEILEQDESGFKGLMMRCRKMVIMDWNPKYTDHWVFDLVKRPDVVFTHSTYKNNRHLQQSVVKEIEAYSPWMFEDMHLPEDQRRPHAENVKSGTADEYRWKVYGLGERANREGLVFPVVTWVDKIPDDVDMISYGMDFGETAQTAIVRTALKKKFPKSDLYLQKLFYHPTKDSDVVRQVLDQLGIDKHVWADNNKPGWIIDLRMAGKEIFATVKFPGSREYWVETLHRFNIHLVRDPDFKKEQENFAYRVVDGKTLSETMKGYDHLWSASGYSVVGDFAQEIGDGEPKQDQQKDGM